MKRIKGIYLSTFLVALLLMFLFAFSFANIFCEFDLISEKMVLQISFIVAVIFAIICVVVTAILIKSEKKTRLGHWLTINSSKLILAFTLLIIFFISIKSELFLTIDDLKELLSLEWVILGISITIFLIWNVVALDYLESKKPTKPKNVLPTKIMRYLHEKGNFYFDATLILSNEYLLLINLIGLCAATGYIYVMPRTVTLFSQSIVILVFFLSTNTIMAFVFDILKPFNRKKREMLQETKLTSEDVKLQNEINDEAKEVLIAVERIDMLDNIDDENKTKLKMELLQNFMDKYSGITDERSESD